MTKITIRCASLLFLLAAACGDTAATSTSAATTTSVAPTTSVATTTTLVGGLDADGRIAQATVVRQFLFDTILLSGEVALDTEALAEGIRSVYPIDVRGSAVDADPEGISIFANSVDSKDVAGPENPYVVAFAVADTTGTCVGGIVFGYPTPDTVSDILVVEGAPCQAGVVYESAGILFDLGLLGS